MILIKGLVLTMELFFLTPDTKNPWGSSLMRGIQLCEIAQNHLADDFACATMKIPFPGKRHPKRSLKIAQQIAWSAKCPRDAIYFVPKQCIERMHPIAAEMLHRRARGVVYDYVDADMASVPMHGADIHLCASHAQYRYMIREQPHGPSACVALLPHGYDSRLERCAPTAGAAHAVYWGALENTHIPSALADDIFLISGAADLSANTIHTLSPYRLHYGVRAASIHIGESIFKPLTKAANAAACGANIIINRDAHDVVDLLGANYPYLVDAHDDDNIVKVFEHARDGVDGHDWVKARSAMDDLAAQLSPESIARQLGLILRPLTE